MAKSSDDVQDDQHSTAKAQDVIATTVQTQLSHISSFDRWLLQWIEDDENHSDVASRVRRRLNRYKEWILGIERASEDFFHDIESWRMSARVRPSSSGGKTITVTGPGSEDPIHISAKDEAEVEHILGVCSCGFCGRTHKLISLACWSIGQISRLHDQSCMSTGLNGLELSQIGELIPPQLQCNALAQAQSTILSLLQATSELNLEESQLR